MPLGGPSGPARLWGAAASARRARSGLRARPRVPPLPRRQLSRGVLILHPDIWREKWFADFSPEGARREDVPIADAIAPAVIFTPLPPQKNECDAPAGRAGPVWDTPGHPGLLQRPLPSRVPSAPGSPSPKPSRPLTSKTGGGSPFSPPQPAPLREGLPGTRPGWVPGGRERRAPQARPGSRVRRAASAQAAGTGHFWSTGR